MPELPEVEVTARALRQAISGCVFQGFRYSGKRLRHAFPRAALGRLIGTPVLSISRRAKYVLLEFEPGWIAVHLGMSGSMEQVRCRDHALGLHDHVMLEFESVKGESRLLVFNDPRRFGSWQWLDRRRAEKSDLGALLGGASSGLEPFDSRFNGQWMAESARSRRVGIKQWLMSGSVVVGVGNIYACESLFEAGIHPLRKASAISRARYDYLANAVRRILQAAIDSGGSTIQNFAGLDGEAGRYGQKHCVYGREGEPCPRCSRPIRRVIIGQRSTFFCHGCQR
ncbi:MAG: bifunctional DNA-formamidopyrimidine glycosylase/DNA-(apurinic or apyrimidinic site) lyase [Betaproteobacteria bacterium]|jgi:formamidopyrimidine-DNA glycosylase|nr:bifunctional DNA-formamidopyrimidine glycosylase/DNA-(apurinic or apyrimidinic site) lyase [Betaproteobacteria bacterium]